jgi:serine/threonine-protein kinase
VGWTPGERLRVLLRVAEAVAFAHSRLVLHCDLKPANVMIGPHGEVLVLDWGIAQIIRRTSEPAATDAVLGAGSGAGTPGYMAPEQVAGAPLLSVGVDVYALGRLLEDALRGNDVDRPLRSIVLRATAAGPADRYDSATAFAADIRAWLDNGRVLAHREAFWEVALRFVRRHQTAIFLLLTYVVVRLFVLVWRGV